MNWFRWFPKTEYMGRQVVDFTSSIRIASDVIARYEAYYPYTLRDGELPWHIAVNYYGDVSFTWLVLLANNIIDPTTEWYMDQKAFNARLVEKYGSVTNAENKVDHYVNVRYGHAVTPETFDALGTKARTYKPLDDSITVPSYNKNPDHTYGFVKYTAMDMEREQNNSRKNIQLLEDVHASKAQRELRDILAQEIR